MWKCKNCKEEVEDQFDVCWNCGRGNKKEVALDKSEQAEFDNIRDEVTQQYNISPTQTNKVVNVTLTGGILGLLAASPQNSLNSVISQENTNGWRVIQVIPAESGNLFLFLLRLMILVLTLFLYTPANGYYLILEKKNKN